MNFCFGVLEKLTNGLLKPDAVPSYLIEHLGGHMVRVGVDEETLDKLVCDAWRRACLEVERVGYGGFLNDVRGAYEVVAKNADPTPVTLALQIRCALIFASVKSLSANVPPGLVARAVANGTWSLTFALVFASHLTKAEQRCELYRLLSDVSPPDRRSELIGKALEATHHIAMGWGRARVLGALADKLEGAARTAVVEEALALARGISDEWERASVLGSLAELYASNAIQGKLTYAYWRDTIDACMGVEREKMLPILTNVSILAEPIREIQLCALLVKEIILVASWKF